MKSDTSNDTCGVRQRQTSVVTATIDTEYFEPMFKEMCDRHCPSGSNNLNDLLKDLIECLKTGKVPE
jgi:hypothetical protein